MSNAKYLVLLSVFFGTWHSIAMGQGKVLVDIYASERTLIDDVLTGDALEATNIRYRGSLECRALFKLTKSRIPFEDGIILSTGDARTIPGVNRKSGFSGIMGATGDPDLEALAKGRTFDAVSFEFDFVAKQDLIKFNYVFGSEEYPEFVGSGFNDVFAFFLTDLETEETTNLAVLPNTNTPVTINTINDRLNANYYTDNRPFKHIEQPSNPIELDGLTKKLTAFSEVTPGRRYRIKIVLADVGDDNLDSAVFLEQGSFESMPKETFYLEYQDYLNGFELPNERRELADSEKDSSLITATEETNLDTLVQIQDRDSSLTPTEDDSVKSPSGILTKDTLTLYFETNSAALSEGETKKLNSWLQNSPRALASFSLEGHTDSIGTEVYNLVLSKRRTEFVLKTLRKSVGEEIKCISSYSGEAKPFSPNNTSHNRALNRRVTLTRTSIN